MTVNAMTGLASARETSVAPWWHSLLVIAFIAFAAVASGLQHGLPRIDLPGLNERVSSYVTVMAGEWFTVLLIAWGLRYHGLSLRDLVSGTWPSYRAILKDLGLAIGFFIVVAPSLGLLIDYLAPDTGATLSGVNPRDGVELMLWAPVSATAGFCEELAFRGYLARQFSAWTGSRTAGLLLQAIGFGIGHAYYNPITMVAVFIIGLFLGLLAIWRRSLRPSMLAHGLMDFMGGLVAFLS